MGSDRIVVGMDSSAAGRAALGWAVTLAAEIGASVTALHVFDIRERADLEMESDLRSAEREARELARTRTMGALADLDSDVPVTIATAHGRLEEVLADAAKGAHTLALGKPQDVDRVDMLERLSRRCRCRVVQVSAQGDAMTLDGHFFATPV